MSAVLLEGAQVVLDDRVECTSVRIEGGIITGLDVPREGAVAIDVKGRVLAPAFVDVHGDAFERQIMPRSGVMMPVDAALLETDRQLGANGIATAYHALTLSWEPGLRSVEMGWKVLSGLRHLTRRLTVENRLQLRWETFCPEAMPLITEALELEAVPSVAFNDHTSPAMLDPSIAVHDRPFDLVSDYPVADVGDVAFLNKMDSRAKRSGLSNADYVARMLSIWSRRGRVADDIAAVAFLARDRGAPLLSHDDSQVATRNFYRAHGSRIAEFPMHERVFQSAREAGDWIVLGAPNVMRGGSHLGSPGAAEMIRRGLCDVLASDYFYPAMLGAVVRLLADGVSDLASLWRLVSANPAEAMGLTDRGTIAPGMRADLVLLDWPDQGMPTPLRTWVSGRGGYSALVDSALVDSGMQPASVA